MGSLEHIGQHYSLGEQQLSDDEACHEEDDDDQGGGDVPHAGSNQDIDFSGYVDEYGFMPLTPLLENALIEAVERVGEAANGGDITKLHIKQDGCLDETRELCRLGYMEESSRYIDDSALYRVTSKGARYMDEKSAYDERKNAWAEARRRERRSDTLFQAAVAMLSFIGGVICAVISGLL